MERIVRAAVRRPGLVAALTALLALGGGVLALGLKPDTGVDTLVSRDSETFQATEQYRERFGEDAIVVLVREPLPQLMLTSDLGRLLGLEGCLSGNLPREVRRPPGGVNGPCARLARGRDRPVQVVYGPGTFVNESVRQIQEQFGAQQKAQAAREKRAMTAARKLAKAQGRNGAERRRLAEQARELVRAEYFRDTLRLALNYGIRSLPRLNDPDFVSQLVFDPRRGVNVPKARFAYLFPSPRAALVQVRLRPGLSDAQRDRAIALVRAATELPEFQLTNGKGRYTVTGAPVVLEALTDEVSSSILSLLVAALVVMALTLLFVFRSPARRGVRLLPLGIALATVGILFGAMALVGASLTMASIAVLPILVGLAVDYAIQFHSRHDEVMREDGLPAERAAPRAAALGGPTIATACLATGAGFLVLALSPVPMVRGFGLLLVIGVGLAFLGALSAGFAALALVPRVPPARFPRWAVGAVRGAGDLLAGAARSSRGALPTAGVTHLGRETRSLARRAWSGAMREAVHRPARVLGIAVALALLGFVLDTQTRVVSDIQKLVPQDQQALRDLDTLQRSSGVSGQIDVTVRADDLTEPEVIKWMTGYQADLLKRFGYREERGCERAELCPALSLPSLFRDPTQASDRERVRALLEAVPPYFSQAVITPDRRMATMAFGIRLMPLDRQQEVIEEMRERLDPPPGVTARLVGLPVLAAEANAKVSSDWRRLLTVLAGLLAVSLALLAVYRRAERALVPLIPIALAAGWSALVLFVLRVPLNPMSVTLGALVIAISTEFSVLLSERYRQERLAGHDPPEALARTYRSTGAAVVASGVTAIAGFAVLVVSDIRMLRDFGFVTVIDLSVSLLGVLIVLPAVLVLAERGELGTLPRQAWDWARGRARRVRLPRRVRSRAA
ncbi:MAG TPA: MMPL family transporter [Solirubrobacteraceae bacterium]|nr:MMPL family transporter [Solirubrobacteraceae bacterium]